MTRRLVLLIACALALVGCGLMDGVGTADQAVVAFHEHYNAGRFGEVYDASAEDLHASEERSEFITTMAALRTKLGSIRGTARIGVSSRIGSDGTFVALEYQTDFENGTGMEEFTWEILDGQARLLSYNVTSRALLR